MQATVKEFGVRLTADEGPLAEGMRRGRQIFDREARGIERRATAMGGRIGRSFRGRNNQILGNVAQQFQDIAVQAEAGTDSIRIFAQQGPQIAGAFGPVGAVIGAVIAVVALGASAFDAFGTETEDAADALKELDLSVGGAASGISELERLALAYSDAISATATSQINASATIVAQTEKEFKAKKSLLELELQRLRAQQSERAAAIAGLERRSTTDIPSRREFIEERLSKAFTAGQELPDVVRKTLSAQFGSQFDERFAFGDFRQQIDAAAAANRDLQEQRAFSDLTDVAIEQLEEALTKSFEDLAAGARKPESGRKKTPQSGGDAFSAARQRIEALEQQTGQIGVYGLALDRLQRRQEAAALKDELLNKLAKEGEPLRDDQVKQVDELAGAYLRAADHLDTLTHQQERDIERKKQAQKAEEDLARSVAQTTEQMFNQIVTARSWDDALKAVLSTIGQLVVKGLFGGGPLGGAFNNAFGVDAGGLASVLFNAKGNAFSASGVTPFAKGGVVSAPTMFGFGRGNLGLMGEAGPEAIMPLKRGADGKLGVAGGGGGTTFNVTVTLGENTTPETRADLRRMFEQEFPRMWRAEQKSYSERVA